MSRPEPLLCGQYYHIYNRGNDGRPLFRERRNYGYFLELYARYVEPVADTYAYCLMSNHFHFLVRIRGSQDCQSLEDWQSYKRAAPSPTCSAPTPRHSTRPISAQAACLRSPSDASWWTETATSPISWCTSTVTRRSTDSQTTSVAGLIPHTGRSSRMVHHESTVRPFSTGLTVGLVLRRPMLP